MEVKIGKIEETQGNKRKIGQEWKRIQEEIQINHFRQFIE